MQEKLQMWHLEKDYVMRFHLGCDDLTKSVQICSNIH